MQTWAFAWFGPPRAAPARARNMSPASNMSWARQVPMGAAQAYARASCSACLKRRRSSWCMVFTWQLIGFDVLHGTSVPEQE